MKKDIIINATSSEIRVALTEDNRLAELFLELPDKERHVGSIFLGRVERVVQGMNAAFVDIGLEQHAFLHFSDAANAGEDFTDLLTDDDEEEEQQKDKESRGGKEQKKGSNDSNNKKSEQKKQDRRPNKQKGSNKQSGNQSGQKEEKPSGDQQQNKPQQDKQEQDKQKKQERGKGQRNNRNSRKSQPSDSRNNEQKSSTTQGKQGQSKQDVSLQNAADKKQENPDNKQGSEGKQDQPQRKRPRPAPRGRHPRPRPKPAEKSSEEIEAAKEATPDASQIQKGQTQKAQAAKTQTEQTEPVQEKKQSEEGTAESTEAKSQRKPSRRRGGRSNSAKKTDGQSTDEQKKSDDSPNKAEQKSSEKETSGEVEAKSESNSGKKQGEAKSAEGSPRSSRSRNSRRREKARKAAQAGQTEKKDEKPENKDEQKQGTQSSAKATANDTPASEKPENGGPTESKPATSDGTAKSESGDTASKPKRRRPSRRKKKPQGESATDSEKTSTQDSADKDSSAKKEKAEPAKESSSSSSEKETKGSSTETTSGSSTVQKSGSASKRRKRPARKKSASSSGTDTGKGSKEDNNEKSGSSRPKTMDAKLPTFQTKRHGEVTIALEKGQDILVQVTRESYASKGVKVSTKISLPGRFIVLLPLDPMVGISRKVLDIKERRRLRAVARKMLPDGFGCIIRTVAQDKETEVLEQELQMLLDRWKSIEDKLKTASTPGVLYRDQSVANTVMRDLFTPDVSRVIIDNKKLYTEIRDYVSWAAPALLNKVEHYTGRSPIFQHCGVEKDMDNMLGPKVWLSTGGYLIMEQTEAMMVIDVNSGRYAKDKEQEINALRTNLESARELARQIRLRDIGGLIIVDFIDLYDEKNRKKVYDELKKEMSRDRAKSVVLPMTQFGLVQMTRQRVRQQLVQTMSEPCPTCNGKGLVQSSSTIIRRMERWLAEFRSETREFRLTLTAHPQLIEYLTEGDSMSRLTKLMLKHFVRIKVVPDEGLGIEQFRFFSVKRQEDITDEYMPK